MTAEERLNKTASELINIIEEMIKDVPEPEAEDVERGIKKILDRLLDEELEKPIDKMNTDIIDRCLDVLTEEQPTEKEPGN